METRKFLDGDIVAFDYETSNFQHIPDAHIFSVSFTWLDGHTEVHYGDFMQRLCEFWRSPCTGIAHNLKFELAFTLKHRIMQNPKKILHDTMIMSQYTDNLCPSHALDYVSRRYAGYVDDWEEADQAIVSARRIYGTYDKIPKYLMLPYQKNDTQRTMLLYRLLWPHVEPKSEYWNEIELVKTTMQFENNGIMIHKPNTLKLIDWASKELEKAQLEGDKIAGRSVNLLSIPQMTHLLFTTLGLPKQKSLDKEALELIDHPIVECIKKARAYRNGVSTLQSYLNLSIDGILYPNIHTDNDDTGRESSSNPNMQNVRKEFKHGQEYTIAARECFRPRPGCFFLLKDYSGIEMRIGVQGTGSERLKNLCAKDFDFHDAYAEAFYGRRYTQEKNKDKKAALRSRAKNGRFARFYGAGLKTLMKTLGLSATEVQAGIDHDKKTFPEFEAYMDKCTGHARRTGYIETFFGRKLRVDPHRPYAATDYCIQGSAAALFKHAQNKVHKVEKILLPVHDELVAEYDNYYLKYLPDICAKIKPLMIDYPQITVPLNVDFSIAKETWNEKTKAA